ncbi:MAG: HAD family phosphatase [Deltaproteobacteria bacterium]|nr:MAG: HAD family phosphatase [Deltaproteobacteria bacterium]
MPPKMLVLDLDGTALTHEGKVHPDDIAAAHALAEAGVHVTIATGRLYTGTRPAAMALGVRGSLAVINGTELLDAETGTVSYGAYLPHPERQVIRELLDTHGVHPFLFASHDIHLAHEAEHHAPYLSIWTEALTRHPDIFAASAWDHHALVAICGVAEHDAIHAMADVIRTDLPAIRPTTFTTFHGDGFVELRVEGDDKGTAIERLAADRGLTAEDVVAVGDWLNDLPMLERAGLSFAMREAAPEAIAAADHTLDAVRGQGGAVAELARRIWSL